MKSENSKIVPAAEKTLRILEYMADSEITNYGVTEISQALGYNKGTVHPILQTLIANHWVEKDMITGKYFLTNKLTLLSIKTEKESRLVTDFQLVGTEMERQCGELINLHYLKGITKASLISKVPSTQHSLRVDFPIGATIPVITSSAGKCLVSELSDEYLTKIFRQCRNHYTSATIQNESAFIEEIHKAREYGYAINNAEYEEGVYSIAAPIRNAKGFIIAAINIVVPAIRYTPNRHQELLTLVQAGAERLSELHGYENTQKGEK